MNQNNFAQVEEHVQKILDKATHENEIIVSAQISSLNLEAKTIDQQILTIYNKLLELKQTADSLDRPEYSLLSKYPKTIIQLIYNRLLFFQKDDCPLLEEAHRTNLHLNKLFKLLEEKKTLLPVFSFDDFLQGLPNVVYYQLKQRPTSTSEDDYRKMTTWQTEKLCKVISLEANHFVQAFRQCLNGEASHPESLREEINQLQTIFREGKAWSREKLEAELFKLRGLTNSLTPDDSKAFHIEMIHFFARKIDQTHFSPIKLLQIQSNYQRTKSSLPTSKPPLLCYSLLRYGDWLQQVTDGKTKITSPLNTDFENLFDQTIREALNQTAINIQNLQSKHSAITTAEEFKDHLFKEIERLRHGLKEISQYKYFESLICEKTLKAKFISNCIFGGDPNSHALALKQAVIIAEESDVLMEELAEKYCDPVLMKNIQNLPTVEFQIVQLINSMVPESKTIQKMLEACAKTVRELKEDIKPFLFIIQDLRECLMELFDNSEQQLWNYFKRLDASYLNEYTTHTIIELREKVRYAKKYQYDLLSQIEQVSELMKDQMQLLVSYAKPIDLSILLTPEQVPEDQLEDPLPSGYSEPVFIPKQSDFRGKGKGPVSFHDIRDIRLFSEFEKELFESKIIDADYNFLKKKGNKEMIAALFHILIQNNYFRKPNITNGRKYELWQYRQYLDHRYNVDTSQQFRRCTPENITGFKYNYTWIQNIAYCR